METLLEKIKTDGNTVRKNISLKNIDWNKMNEEIIILKKTQTTRSLSITS